MRCLRVRKCSVAWKKRSSEGVLSLTHIPLSKIKLEDTKPERRMRRILEALQSVISFPFHSQVEEDFVCFGNFAVAVKGPHHKTQNQIEKDAWKRRKLEEQGFRVIDFTDEEILQYPELVATILLCYWTMSRSKAREMRGRS